MTYTSTLWYALIRSLDRSPRASATAQGDLVWYLLAAFIVIMSLNWFPAALGRWRTRKGRATTTLLRYKLAAQYLRQRLLDIDPTGVICHYSYYRPEDFAGQVANRNYHELATLVKKLNDTVARAIGLMEYDLHQAVLDLFASRIEIDSIPDRKIAITELPEIIDARMTIFSTQIASLVATQGSITAPAAPPKTRPNSRPGKPVPTEPPRTQTEGMLIVTRISEDSCDGYWSADGSITHLSKFQPKKDKIVTEGI